MTTSIRLFLALVSMTLLAPVSANHGTLSVSCGVVCGTHDVPCGGHLQPACTTGHACDGSNVAFTLPPQYVETYSCPGFPCNGAEHTFTQGCYDPLDPPTCGQCSANAQYQCVPETGCGGACDPGLTPDANGFCRPCGSEGEPVCEDGEPACEGSLVIAGGECHDDCGGAGQTLCPNGSCQDWHFDTGVFVCAACGGDPAVPGSVQSICPSGPACRPGVVQEALALSPRPKVIWMQLGVRNDEAAHLAEANGIKVVMNRCPKIEYGRLSGEIGWAGVNSRMLSSKRPLLGTKGGQQRALRSED